MSHRKSVESDLRAADQAAPSHQIRISGPHRVEPRPRSLPVRRGEKSERPFVGKTDSLDRVFESSRRHVARLPRRSDERAKMVDVEVPSEIQERISEEIISKEKSSQQKIVSILSS